MSPRQYQHPLSHYPEVYGVSYRTILRWSEKGLPLDDPETTRLLLSTGAKPAPHGAPEASSARPRAKGGALGLASALARLEAEEAEAHASYRQAVDDGDESLAEIRRSQWIKINEALRKAAVSSPEVAEANKKLISLDEVSSALTELFVIHRQDLENLGKRISAELVGKDEISIREIIARETILLIESLYSCSYLDGGKNE